MCIDHVCSSLFLENNLLCIFIIVVVVVCVYLCKEGDTCASAYLWRPEDNFVAFSPSTFVWISGIEPRLVWQVSLIVRYLISPIIHMFNA